MWGLTEKIVHVAGAIPDVYFDGGCAMGWSIGYDENLKRDIGYGVPAYCDHPGCMKEIDRGLSYVCGGEPFGGENGCGLYFCEDHRGLDAQCECCANGTEPFEPKPDHPKWVHWKQTDPSWQQWRDEQAK